MFLLKTIGQSHGMYNRDKQQTKIQNYIHTGHKGLEQHHCKIVARKQNVETNLSNAILNSNNNNINDINSNTSNNSNNNKIIKEYNNNNNNNNKIRSNKKLIIAATTELKLKKFINVQISRTGGNNV